MIILHVFAYVANQRYEIYQFGEYEERYKWFTVLTIIAVLTVVAAMHHERFIDTMSYIKTSLNVAPSWDNIIRILNGNGKDKAFYILSCMLRGLLGNHYRIYLGIIAVFCLLRVFSVYRKHSSSLFVMSFLFIALGEYVMWIHNGIHQFIAASMIFAATDLLLNKKIRRIYCCHPNSFDVSWLRTDHDPRNSGDSGKGVEYQGYRNAAGDHGSYHLCGCFE